MSRLVASCLAALVFGCSPQPASQSGPSPQGSRLTAAQSWMYQLAGLEDPAAVDALAATDYPLLVIEPGLNHRACTGDETGAPGDAECADPYDTPAIVEALATTPSGEPRVLLAYIDVGQAEDWRTYWTTDWAPPQDGQPGNPAFIVAEDPDGWAHNYTVAYWRTGWRAIWLGPDGLIAQLARAGFDGVYLDWVEAYDDEAVIAAAQADGVHAAQEMVRFIADIKAAGRAVSDDFVVIVQNAPYLVDDSGDPAGYLATIDGLAVEDTWFYGDGDAPWTAGEAGSAYTVADRVQCEQSVCDGPLSGMDNVCLPDDHMDLYSCRADMPVAGDLHGGYRHADEWSTQGRLDVIAKYIAAGLPVFSVDYCVSQANAAQVYADAAAAGMRPLVTRVSLDNLTETPAP